MKGLFRTFFLKRAARAYAARLPRQIRKDYGSKQWYSFGQILNATRAAGLDIRYLILALARYLPLGEFQDLRIETPVLLGYEEARTLFMTYEPVLATSHAGDEPPPEVSLP